ncbi:hypothetical protein POX08_20410, partial [Enterobacter roggenkampii]
MMSLWDALRMNMMISYQELVRTFPNVYYVHAFASPGWADHDAVANFSAWFAAAENESAVYKSGQRT